MRDSLKWTVGWLWVLAFFALPSCSFDVSGLGGFGNLTRGPLPHSSAIFCDIENKAMSRRCATPNDKLVGVRLTAAAIALTRSQSSSIGLDYSPEARASMSCGDEPLAITFLDPIPDGRAICLNCGSVMPSPYPEARDACVDYCEDQNGVPLGKTPPDPDVAAFCASTDHVRASINTSGCVAGACLDAGSLRPDFVEPRRTLEPVAWTSLIGVATSGADSNTLTRTALTTGAFDAGAASTQTFTRGDGYVEFTVTETNRARVLGLSLSGLPDTDPSLMDMRFGVRLSTDGHVFIFENGVLVPGPNPDMSFTTYAAGDRLRLTVTDAFGGQASIAYFLIPSITPGPLADGVRLRDAPGTEAYPFRVNASLREGDATLTDVRIVRIK